MGKAAQRASQIQVDARTPAQLQPPTPDASETPKTPAENAGWGWSVVVFLWATAFAFMLIYELLAAALKAASRLF
jgi:hypothetical protein